MGLLARRALGRLDAVFAISDHVAQSALRAGVPPERLRRVPVGVDIELFAPGRRREQTRRALGLADGERLLLYVGNMRPAKGIQVLAEAFVRLGSRWPHLKLLMMLEFSHRGYARMERAIGRRFAQARLSDRVRSLGVVANMAEVMAAADVLVVPFLTTDGPADHPLCLLEGMAAGLGVVASRVGGIPEVVRDGQTGLLVEPGDVGRLVEALHALLRDEAGREAFGRRAREEAVTRFDARQTSARTEQAYAEVCSWGNR